MSCTNALHFAPVLSCWPLYFIVVYFRATQAANDFIGVASLSASIANVTVFHRETSLSLSAHASYKRRECNYDLIYGLPLTYTLPTAIWNSVFKKTQLSQNASYRWKFAKLLIIMRVWVSISIPLLLCFYRYSTSNNGVSLKCGLRVIQDHWK